MSHLKGHVDKRMNYSETDYQILFKSLLQKKPKNALHGKLGNRVNFMTCRFFRKRHFRDFYENLKLYFFENGNFILRIYLRYY